MKVKLYNKLKESLVNTVQ